MAKKGDIARQSVAQTIINAFQATNDFVTFQDKKIYVTAKDGENGETLQFAITMTMPKTPVAAAPQTTASPDKNELPMETSGMAIITPVEISPEDKQKVQELKRALGIAN